MVLEIVIVAVVVVVIVVVVVVVVVLLVSEVVQFMGAIMVHMSLLVYNIGDKSLVSHLNINYNL